MVPGLLLCQSPLFHLSFWVLQCLCVFCPMVCVLDFQYLLLKCTLLIVATFSLSWCWLLGSTYQPPANFNIFNIILILSCFLYIFWQFCVCVLNEKKSSTLSVSYRNPLCMHGICTVCVCVWMCVWVPVWWGELVILWQGETVGVKCMMGFCDEQEEFE